MKLSYEQLNELKGYDLSGDSFFSEGTVILIDGGAYELIEEIGCDLFFEPSSDIDTASENDLFFYGRNKD